MSTPNPFGANGALVPGVKISALPEATTPLTGAELVAVVQGGITRQATAADLGSSGGTIAWTGIANGVLAAGANNNLGTDISTAARLRLTPAGDADLSGLQGGENGKLLFIQNMSAAFTITILAESGLSAAANRFAINGDLTVPPRCGALFIYDTTLNRWVKS